MLKIRYIADFEKWDSVTAWSKTLDEKIYINKVLLLNKVPDISKIKCCNDNILSKHLYLFVPQLKM
jgi:hypothetical protein